MNPVKTMLGGFNLLQVNIFSLLCLNSVGSPGPATATYTLSNTGAGSASNNSGWTWRLYGASADYEVFATATSGIVSTGTTGSWLGLGTSQSWSVTRSGAVGSKLATITLKIRRISDGKELDIGNVIDMEADTV